MASLKSAIRGRLLKLLDAEPILSYDDNLGSEIVDGWGHRDYVGGLWEGIGSLQFKFMVERGLEPHHVLVDIACGSLRGGVRFVPYLDRGNYLGIDINERLLDAGIRIELGAALRQLKSPEFVISESFEFERFSKRPDFALAQSLFTHLTENDIIRCLRKLKVSARDNTKFYATFFETDHACINPQQSHPHGDFLYTKTQMMEFGAKAGWSVRYLGDWNHPRGQKMMEYSVAR
ncbi:MAG: class I SAM-dependent methyltransferase [Xanthobacteraceae bacterium]